MVCLNAWTFCAKKFYLHHLIWNQWLQLFSISSWVSVNLPVSHQQSIALKLGMWMTKTLFLFFICLAHKFEWENSWCISLFRPYKSYRNQHHNQNHSTIEWVSMNYIPFGEKALNVAVKIYLQCAELVTAPKCCYRTVKFVRTVFGAAPNSIQIKRAALYFSKFFHYEMRNPKNICFSKNLNFVKSNTQKVLKNLNNSNFWR